MLDQDKLISLLNNPGPHSGTKLGEQLGVSRVAVQKRIQGLVQNGLPIEAVSGKGYSLPADVQLLDSQEILSHVNETACLAQLEVFQSVESTNSYLLQQPIQQGRLRVCVAESQSMGRGRRGNNWQSSPYRNLMLSLSWGFSRWPETITGLGLAVALVVTEYLNATHNLAVRIKWPNDLMVDDKKLAGVLIDIAGESSGVCNVVIGLGLNVHQPDWSRTDEGGYQWQDLSGLGVSTNRNYLVAGIISSLSGMLQGFEQDGFEPMVQRWNNLSSFAGRKVRVGAAGDMLEDVPEGVVFEGTMLGVDAAGALLIRDSVGQVHRFTDSNVSVRLI